MANSDLLRELRFTRSRQAVVMIAWGMAFLLASMVLLSLRLEPVIRRINPDKLQAPPALIWGLLPLPIAIGFFWLAWSHLRHPYLALTRVGIEIYPFFLPSKNMNLVLWQQIKESVVSDKPAQLILTMADRPDSKIFITLDPLALPQRRLLARALEGVQENREKVTREVEAKAESL